MKQGLNFFSQFVPYYIMIGILCKKLLKKKKKFRAQAKLKHLVHSKNK